MTTRERILLALTVIGFVAPNAMVIVFLADHGLALGTYFGDWVKTLPAAQLGVDLSIAFVAFALWAAWEGRRIGQRTWWVPIPAAGLVGMCFAVPLFLLLRERTLRTGPHTRLDIPAPVNTKSGATASSSASRGPKV